MLVVVLVLSIVKVISFIREYGHILFGRKDGGRGPTSTFEDMKLEKILKYIYLCISETYIEENETYYENFKSVK